MIIGTLCFSHSARSCSSRLLERCTIWLTANGADSRSGCALSCVASSSLIRTSHSSSSAGGRAFSAGNDPTIPALHCAITRSGTEIINSGAPITGSNRRPLNKAGMDIQECFWLFRESAMHWSKDARHHTNMAIARSPIAALLTQRTGDVVFGTAVARLTFVTRQVDLGRALLGGVGIEALALLETLGLTELVGAGLAIRRAVGRDRTSHPSGHHRGWLGQTRQAVAGIFRACVQ